MNYKLIRSRRRSLGLEVRDGEVIVRAPYLASKRKIERFVAEHEGWIEKHLRLESTRREKLAGISKLTEAEINELAERAKEVIPQRVAYYAPLVGVSYGRITIRRQRSRWGSCSVKGNLNFNCLLMLAPPEVLDSVVVHELCHRKEMNHSKRFYAEVLRVFPEYHRWHGWLKENGDELMYKIKG
ncbi:MAG: M48 family metallopeptidase [Firmicutes bacterium]|nr:M48 family metallopeptidase [Bacillota bacterium]